MNFSRVLVFVFACLVAMCAVSAAPEPRWKGLKKFGKFGPYLRDGAGIRPHEVALYRVRRSKCEPANSVQCLYDKCMRLKLLSRRVLPRLCEKLFAVPAVPASNYDLSV
ncbi:hypothetical protein PYW07_009896 [Mythimna separata]|uniref:Uncharacterized protein n=1 Tax=Mythimna separata TaxID=271217 RepID=A0AAD8DQH6_MYTSE|nr:hypothetical protein PYW07_009896 [Mythimna separata]